MIRHLIQGLEWRERYRERHRRNCTYLMILAQFQVHHTHFIKNVQRECTRCFLDELDFLPNCSDHQRSVRLENAEELVPRISFCLAKQDLEMPRPETHQTSACFASEGQRGGRCVATARKVPRNEHVGHGHGRCGY